MNLEFSSKTAGKPAKKWTLYKKRVRRKTKIWKTRDDYKHKKEIMYKEGIGIPVHRSDRNLGE